MLNYILLDKTIDKEDDIIAVYRRTDIIRVYTIEPEKILS